MKKIFSNPEIEIMILGQDDIITTSTAGNDEEGNMNSEMNSSTNETYAW